MPNAPAIIEHPSPAGLEPELDFEAVYREHAAFVWRCLRRLGVAQADVSDCCQDVFVTVHRRLHTFNATSSVRTWLFGIALRKAADHRRLARHRHEQVVADLPDAPVAAHQAADLERKRARALLERVLDELDDEKRAVLILFELEQLSMQEVAEAVGCPVQTAYARLYAARRAAESAIRRLQLCRGKP